MTAKFRHIDWVFLGLGLIALAIVLSCVAGCMQSRTEGKTATEKQDRLAIAGTVTIPTPDGPRPIPISITVDRNGSEQQTHESQTKTGIDGAAIAQQIATVLGPLLAATSSGVPFGPILQNAGTVITGLGMSYLALQKRKQMKQDKPK